MFIFTFFLFFLNINPTISTVNSLDISIHNLGPNINSVLDEYFPILTVNNDLLFFTRKSFRNEDLYYSKKDSDGNWAEATSMYPFNQPLTKEGASSISADGKTIYLTLCNEPGNFGKCDLYTCERIDDTTWTKARNLGETINLPGGWQSQPSIAGDNRTLYFASDREGGYGKIDIWQSYLQDDGSWSKPVNLGHNVNTPNDDQTPFIHIDNCTLYFSTNRLNSSTKGIFISRKAEQGWSKPTELVYPINTDEDNFAMTVTTNGQQAYFASYRPGGYGKADLYGCRLPEEYKPEKVVIYQAQVIGKQNLRPIKEGWVKIINVDLKELIFNHKLNRFDGSFLASLKPGHTYLINIGAKNHSFYSKRIKIEPNTKHELVKVIEQLDPIKVGTKSILYNVLFETDKAILNPESLDELNNLVRFIKENPGIKIGVYGHTDNTFTAEHNQLLSEQRARVVYYYLLKSLMSQKQLVLYQGFGDTDPIATNSTDLGKQLNRRSEIVILKE